MSTWIGSSFISVFMLFMGGILIGHLLWYRDRSSDLRAIKDAETKYNRARTAARNRKRKFVLLSRDAKLFEQTSHECREEADSLRQSLSTQQQRADELEKELGKLHAEQSRYELACRDAQQERDAALGQVENVAGEVARLQDSLQAAEANLQEALTKADEHASDTASARSELSLARQRGDELATANEQYQSDVSELQSQLEVSKEFSHQLSCERDVVQEERGQLIQHRDRLQSECDQLAAKYSQLEQAHDLLKNERDQLAQLRVDGVRELEKISMRGESLAVETEQLRSRCDELILLREKDTQEREELIRERDLSVDQRHQLTRSRDQLVLVQDEITAHRDQLAQELESLTAQHTLLVSEHDAAVNERQLLAAERDALICERDRLAEQQTAGSTQASHRDEKLIELQREYDVLRDQHAAAISANQDQSRQLELHHAEIERLERMLSESIIQDQTMQSEHDELLDQLDERTSRIQTAIDGRVTAEIALSEMETRIESLLSELAEANDFRTQYETKLAEMQRNGGEAEAQSHKLRSTIRDKDQQIVEMEKRIAEQSIAIDRHCAEAERLRAGGPELKQLREIVAKKSAALVAAETDLQSSQAETAKLQSSIDSRDGQISSLGECEQQVRTQLANQTAVIGRLKEELVVAAEQLESAKVYQLKVAEYETQMTEYQTQLTQHQNQVAAIQNNMVATEARSEGLQNQLHRVSAELDASLDANAAMQQRLRLIEGQLHENAVAMRDLRRKRANVPALSAGALRDQNKAA